MRLAIDGFGMKCATLWRTGVLDPLPAPYSLPGLHLQDRLPSRSQIWTQAWVPATGFDKSGALTCNISPRLAGSSWCSPVGRAVAEQLAVIFTPGAEVICGVAGAG